MKVKEVDSDVDVYGFASPLSSPREELDARVHRSLRQCPVQTAELRQKTYKYLEPRNETNE
jgi:hypothetical protein